MDRTAKAGDPLVVCSASQAGAPRVRPPLRGRGIRSMRSFWQGSKASIWRPHRRRQKKPSFARVSLDLIGLPPTPAEIDEFVSDRRPDAYERLVDRLLASPHYGERWARPWLDLARYADTNGYEDGPPPRDSGSIATGSSRRSIATCRSISSRSSRSPATCCPTPTWNRRSPPASTAIRCSTRKAASIRKSAYGKRSSIASTPRPRSGSAHAGLRQCHNHKYDPFTQKEYYQLLRVLQQRGVQERPRIIEPQARSAHRPRRKTESRLETEIRDLHAAPRRSDARTASGNKRMGGSRPAVARFVDAPSDVASVHQRAERFSSATGRRDAGVRTEPAQGDIRDRGRYDGRRHHGDSTRGACPIPRFPAAARAATLTANLSHGS